MVDDGASWREPAGKWPPAGKSWKEALAPEDVLGIAAADVQAREPARVAGRWADLLQARQQNDAVALDMGTIRFVHPVDSDGTGVVGIDIAVRNPAAVLDRAKANGIPVRSDAVWICGTALRPVLPQA
jgi:hypothetical protein